MKSKGPAPEDFFNLEKHLKLLETPFAQVCRVLGLEESEPSDFLQAGRSVFLFDPDKKHVFNGAVIIDDGFGFYGIKVGDNWLATADRLESQGFVQANELERFTKPGQGFGISVYLYHDESAEASSSTVKEYSICPRYGQTP